MQLNLGEERNPGDILLIYDEECPLAITTVIGSGFRIPWERLSSSVHATWTKKR